MPSPMALSPAPPPAPSRSLFARKPKSSSSLSAADYLTAVHAADQRARERGATPPPPAPASSTSSTPALSLSSTATRSSGGSSSESARTRQGTPRAGAVPDGDDEYEDNEDGLGLPAVPPTSAQAVPEHRHTEFGYCWNDAYRCTSAHPPGTPFRGHVEVDPPYYILLTTYISYIILIVIGHLRDFVGKRGKSAEYRHLKPHNGYAPLTSDFDSFYVRRLKSRIDDCFLQPITGVAGRTLTLYDRFSTNNNKTQALVGSRTRVLNISSYNYLGFAQARGGCAEPVEECLRRYGVHTGGARREAGTLDLHVSVEALVARFVGMEDATIFSTGFSTNTTVIPAFVGKGALVISDELNHSSIRVGVRYSGASVRMFKHNDMASLEALLREVISQGQPKTHRPWKKILLIVEGLYSMEGTMCDLLRIIELKQKYKFYLFVDEAHSIGALGPNGRGVCDYFGVDPRSIDILMGTFTKSFGAAGGYIAGNKALIDRLRLATYSGPYAEAMAPPVLMQVLASMASIMGVAPAPAALGSPASGSSALTITGAGEHAHPGPAPAAMLPGWLTLAPAMRDGSEGRLRLRRLCFNARYLHAALDKLGFITYGAADSPIVPVLIFNPGKMAVFHRMMKQRPTPIVVVVVAYPATPLISSRVRFCLSAAHTKDDVDTVLRAIDEVGDVLDLKHGLQGADRWPLERVLASAVELANLEQH